MTSDAVRWRLKDGAWRRLHPGVYLTFTGPIPWHTRASAAILRCGPDSALILDSAAFLWGMTLEEPEVVTVGVPLRRHPRPGAGMTVVRRRRLSTTRIGTLRVTRAAQTIVDLADLPDRTIQDAVGYAARAAQRKIVTEARLLAELAERARHRNRRELQLACGVLGDGAESVAELLFVTRVQRAHQLPVFAQQVRTTDSGTRADFRHPELRVIVEIDGWLWHGGERFHTDRQRDRQAAARGEVTVRASWLDVHSEPCELAYDLWQICRHRGWDTPFRRCSPTCTASQA